MLTIATLLTSCIHRAHSALHAGCHSALRVVPAETWHGQRHYVCRYRSGRNRLPLHRASSVECVWLQASHDQFGSSASIMSPRATTERHCRTQGLGFFAIGAIAIIPVKPRVPIGRPRTAQETSSSNDRSHARPKVNWSFLRRNTFYAFGGSILFSSLGNFLPTVWIPSESRWRLNDCGNSSKTGLQPMRRTWALRNRMALPYSP
jgi:hypothetical protein